MNKRRVMMRTKIMRIIPMLSSIPIMSKIRSTFLLMKSSLSPSPPTIKLRSGKSIAIPRPSVKPAKSSKTSTRKLRLGYESARSFNNKKVLLFLSLLLLIFALVPHKKLRRSQIVEKNPQQTLRTN